MPSPLFPGSPAPAEREDPESQLLQAVIERHPERSLELVQRLVHRRGLAALGTFQQITLPRLVDDEARCWLDTLLLQVPQGVAPGRGLESCLVPADQGMTSASQEDPQPHDQRASAAIDAAIAAMVAEFPELASAGSPLDHSADEPPVQPVLQRPTSAWIPEPDPFADSLMTAIPEPLAAGSLPCREPLLPSPPHDPPELSSSSPKPFGAATNLAGRLRRRLGGLRNQVISPITQLLAFSPESPGSALPLSSSLASSPSSSPSLPADPAQTQAEPAASPPPRPEHAGSGLGAARGSLAMQTPAMAWEHAAPEPAPVPAALADLRAWLPDPNPQRIR